MPEVGFGGELFSLRGQAGFDEGIVRGNIGGGVRTGFEARAELCHGLSLELSRDARAELEGALGLLWTLRAQAEGEAFVAAGVKLDVRITPDVFDQVGLTLDAAAYIEASAAGWLSIAFDLQDVYQRAREQMPGPAYDLFMAFVREVSIGVGVWGKVSFAAAAEFSLLVRGSLANDESAGFVISNKMGAGLGAGCGYDFYVGVKFNNPKRFFVNAVDIMTGEILREARTVLPPSVEPHLVVLEYLLPASMASAYELGQLAATDLIRGPGVAMNAFVGCFVAELQRFLFDKLGWAAMSLVAEEINARAYHIEELELTDDERAALGLEVQALIDALEGDTLRFSVVHEHIEDLAALLRSVHPDGEARWRPLLAAAWLAFAAADSLRSGITPAHASFDVGVIGLGSVAGDEYVLAADLPPAPDVVLAEISHLLGDDPSQVSLGVAIAHIAATRVVTWLAEESSEMKLLLELLAGKTGLSAADVVDLGMRGGLAGRLEDTHLYHSLRDTARDGLDGLLLGDLFTLLQQELPEDDDVSKWLDGAARPALVLLRHFVLDSLDQIVEERDLSAAFFDAFRTGLGLMVGKIVIDNVIVLADILETHVYEHVSDATAALAADVRGDKHHVVATAAKALAGELVPSWVPVPANLAEAAQYLAADLLDAASLGLEILDEDYRSEVLQLQKRCLLSVFGVANSTDPSDLVNVMNQVSACAYLPEPVAALELVELQAKTTARYLEAILPPTIDAVRAFCLRVATGQLEAIEDAVRRALNEVRRQLVQLGKAVALLLAQAERLLGDIEDLGQEIEAQLREAENWLKSSDRRSDLLNDLKKDGRGEAKDAAERAARSVPGFYLQPADWRAAEVREARSKAGAAFDLAFDAVSPLLDDALKVIGDVAGDLADVFSSASDLAGFLAEMAGDLNDQVDAAVSDISGLDLPEEISIDSIVSSAAGLAADSDFTALIEDAFTNRAEQKRIQDDHGRIVQRAETKEEQRRGLETQRAMARGAKPAVVTICRPHPAALSAEDAWAYGTAVPVEIAIENVILPTAPSWDGRETLTGALVAVNGTSIALGGRPWHCSAGRASLSHTLTAENAPLRPGLNILECSYASGFHSAVRATVAFLVHESPPPVNVFTPGKRTDLTGWNLYQSDGTRYRLQGTFSADEPGVLPRHVQRDSTSRPSRRTGPPVPCEPRSIVVDRLRRFRGEQLLKEPS